jgi:hypothetical protein
MKSNTSQVADQTFKGSLVAFLSYIALKLGADDQFIILATPVFLGFFAYISGFFGDTKYNSFFTNCEHVEKE